MSLLDPSNCTLGDICTSALEDCGRLGTGQTAQAQDLTKAWARCQMMLQEWQQKRWLVYHLVTYSKVATGQTSYTFGPGGEINTNAVASWGLESLAPLTGGGGFNYALNDTITLAATPPSGTPTAALTVKVTGVTAGAATSISIVSNGNYPAPLPNSWTQSSTSGTGSNISVGFPVWGLATTQIVQPSGSQRPPKIESAFLRQIQVASPNQVDYPLNILQSMEDYNKIALKSLSSFPGAVFLDSQIPLGNLFCYPVPQANIYSINVSVMQQLQTRFLSASTVLNFPWEYYSAINYNLALRLRGVFQIPPPLGDQLPGLAANALNVLRGPNTQIARLVMPEQLMRPNGIYNIFSDRKY